MKEQKITRRKILQRSALSVVGMTLPFSSFGQATFKVYQNIDEAYPSIGDEVISEVVGKSHFNLDRVKELVDKRPELANACWQWRFGDFETAVGAASHVGRRDIILYLLSKGARADIFTYATLGAYGAVKNMIEYTPGIQQNPGPHGISLLKHAQAGLRMSSDMTAAEIDSCNELIEYLESLGDADGKEYDSLKDEEKEKYLGDYQYGTVEGEGFSVKLNMRKMLSLGPIGEFGGALYKIGEHQFTYNGAPSVKVSFEVDGNEVRSLTVTDPDGSVVARKVS